LQNLVKFEIHLQNVTEFKIHLKIYDVVQNPLARSGELGNPPENADEVELNLK